MPSSFHLMPVSSAAATLAVASFSSSSLTFNGSLPQSFPAFVTIKRTLSGSSPLKMLLIKGFPERAAKFQTWNLSDAAAWRGVTIESLSPDLKLKWHFHLANPFPFSHSYSQSDFVDFVPTPTPGCMAGRRTSVLANNHADGRQELIFVCVSNVAKMA